MTRLLWYEKVTFFNSFVLRQPPRLKAIHFSLRAGLIYKADNFQSHPDMNRINGLSYCECPATSVPYLCQKDREITSSSFVKSPSRVSISPPWGGHGHKRTCLQCVQGAEGLLMKVNDTFSEFMRK